MKSKTLLIFLCIGASFFASAWDHVKLESTTGEKISIDFQKEFQPIPEGCYKCSKYVLASPVWVNIDGISSDSEVRVVFLNRFRNSYSSSQALTGGNPPTIADLYLDQSGKFTAELVNPQSYTEKFTINSEGYGGKGEYFQELAVVVDGRWLVDPISGSNNFKFRMHK